MRCVPCCFLFLSFAFFMKISTFYVWALVTVSTNSYVWSWNNYSSMLWLTVTWVYPMAFMPPEAVQRSDIIVIPGGIDQDFKSIGSRVAAPLSGIIYIKHKTLTCSPANPSNIHYYGNWRLWWFVLPVNRLLSISTAVSGPPMTTELARRSVHKLHACNCMKNSIFVNA